MIWYHNDLARLPTMATQRAAPFAMAAPAPEAACVPLQQGVVAPSAPGTAGPAAPSEPRGRCGGCKHCCIKAHDGCHACLAPMSVEDQQNLRCTQVLIRHLGAIASAWLVMLFAGGSMMAMTEDEKCLWPKTCYASIPNMLVGALGFYAGHYFVVIKCCCSGRVEGGWADAYKLGLHAPAVCSVLQLAILLLGGVQCGFGSIWTGKVEHPESTHRGPQGGGLQTELVGFLVTLGIWWFGGGYATLRDRLELTASYEYEVEHRRLNLATGVSEVTHTTTETRNVYQV